VFGGEEAEWEGVRSVDVRLFNGFEVPPLHRLGQVRARTALISVCVFTYVHICHP
jgi:hypothetical protein